MQRWLALVVLAVGCAEGAGTAPENLENETPTSADLSGFAIVRLDVAGVGFEAWVARTPAQRTQGLKYATPAQVAPLAAATPRGMFFVFPFEFPIALATVDVPIPLDLAYVRVDGTIAEIHALDPLDPVSVVASEPVQFALQAPQGTFAAFGITVGALVDLSAIN